MLSSRLFLCRMESLDSPCPHTLRTIFADEPARPKYQLSMRRIWPQESIVPTLQIGIKALIPKPSGEVGRPGRNGYSLSSALGWDRVAYKKVQVGSFYQRSTLINLLCQDTYQRRSECQSQKRCPVPCPRSRKGKIRL